MDIGKVIRQLRQQRGLSQERLAELCSVSPVSLSRIETGRHGVSVRLLSRVATAFQMELPQLLALSGAASEENIVSDTQAVLEKASEKADEQQMLECFRRLRPDRRAICLALCVMLAEDRRAAA